MLPTYNRSWERVSAWYDRNTAPTHHEVRQVGPNMSANQPESGSMLRGLSWKQPGCRKPHLSCCHCPARDATVAWFAQTTVQKVKACGDITASATLHHTSATYLRRRRGSHKPQLQRVQTCNCRCSAAFSESVRMELVHGIMLGELVRAKLGGVAKCGYISVMLMLASMKAQGN